jgi:hypothetical protein
MTNSTERLIECLNKQFNHSFPVNALSFENLVSLGDTETQIDIVGVENSGYAGSKTIIYQRLNLMEINSVAGGMITFQEPRAMTHAALVQTINTVANARLNVDDIDWSAFELGGQIGKIVVKQLKAVVGNYTWIGEFPIVHIPGLDLTTLGELSATSFSVPDKLPNTTVTPINAIYDLIYQLSGVTVPSNSLRLNMVNVAENGIDVTLGIAPANGIQYLSGSTMLNYKRLPMGIVVDGSKSITLNPMLTVEQNLIAFLTTYGLQNHYREFLIVGVIDHRGEIPIDPYADKNRPLSDFTVDESIQLIIEEAATALLYTGALQHQVFIDNSQIQIPLSTAARVFDLNGFTLALRNT